MLPLNQKLRLATEKKIIKFLMVLAKELTLTMKRKWRLLLHRDRNLERAQGGVGPSGAPPTFSRPSDKVNGGFSPDRGGNTPELRFFIMNGSSSCSVGYGQKQQEIGRSREKYCPWRTSRIGSLLVGPAEGGGGQPGTVRGSPASPAQPLLESRPAP